MNAYCAALRVASATVIVNLSMVIVVSDVNEKREPFEMVPVSSPAPTVDGGAA